MPSKTRLSKSFLALLLMLTLLPFAPDPAHAQTTGQLTPEQQRALMALPAAQREALLRRFGVSNRAGDQAGSAQPQGDDPSARRDDSASVPLPPVDPGLMPRDTVILIVSPRSDVRLDDEQRTAMNAINDRNPYRLGRRGQLRLPGLPDIQLAGLTEDQARLRLRADPGLTLYDVEFHRLPVTDPDDPELEPFGYGVFSSDPQRFAISTSVPVPSDYTVGPGDTVLVQFFGANTASYAQLIDRGGVLNLPELGPVSAGGLTFDALREEIRMRVSRKLIGVEVSVTLGELRSVRVFLAGDVVEPGAYQVNAFATMTNVLALGGGISETGSLRNVQLKRDGQVVSRLDLYSLLLSGNARGDRRVADGDVVFVPPAGPRVTVAGQVQRPAIYEFSGRTSVREAIGLAGGSLPNGSPSNARVERQSPDRGVDVYDVDITSDAGAGFIIADGDRVVVPGAFEQFDRAVEVIGNARRTGAQPWRPGLRLSQLLPTPASLMPQADRRYVLIRRQPSANGPIEVLSADLQAIWDGAAGARDPELMARDGIVVFSLDDGRYVLLEPILVALRLQAQSGEPTAVVSVDGEVKMPGQYPLERNMSIDDLIRAAGGLSESAYVGAAELRRYTSNTSGRRESELIELSLSDVTGAGAGMATALRPFDHLNVKRLSNWGAERFLEISGDVAFPGRYSISRGETLSSVLERAGGVAETAFPAGSVFTREVLREREREQLEDLAARIESDLATLALSNPDQVDAISTGQSLLRQIRTTEPTGRLVIDMEAILEGDSAKDVIVRDGDSLFVPQRSQEVTVIGEVQYATSHLWQAGLVRDDYIDRSGGLTAKADGKRIYVVRASGEVMVGSRSRFYSRADSFEIRAGDTIVVPLKTDRVAPIVAWSGITQIIYNLAIAAAAVNSF